jgi:predicted outer membrane protein
MKNIFLKKLTATLIVSAGILAIDVMPSIAQTTPSQGNSSANQNTNNQSSASGQRMQGKSMGMDATFIKRASEGNLAEVELGTMALQKASSQAVKDFAQQMIDHHTKANEQLISIVSGSANISSNSTRDQSVPTTGNTTTQQNKNNASDDANMNDNDQQTNGSISSATNDNTVQGNNESNTRTNNPDRNISDGTGGGGSGANSGGTTSSTSTNRVGGTEMNEGPTDNTGTSDQTGLHSSSGNLRTSDDNARTMSGTSGNSNGGFENPIATTLSPEHAAIRSKLSGLSGEEFDQAYMQAMVKDHAKTIALFESQIKKGQNTEVVTFAKSGLPMIREHYQKAQALSGSKGNMNKSSSTGKSSGSK